MLSLRDTGDSYQHGQEVLIVSTHTRGGWKGLVTDQSSRPSGPKPRLLHPIANL